MGTHHTMVEYYPGTKSSHLLVTMFVHRKASEHSELHTLHHGSNITRCILGKLGAVSPLFIKENKGSSTGRSERILLPLLFFPLSFFFFCSLFPCNLTLFFILLSHSGCKIGMMSVAKPSKIHRPFCRAGLSSVLSTTGFCY